MDNNLNSSKSKLFKGPTRFLLLGLAWGVAIFEAYPNPRALSSLPLLALFPYGLVFWLARLTYSKLNNDGSPNFGIGAFFITAWLVYAVLSIFALTTKKCWRFFIAYGILIVLLLLNVTGCHHMLQIPGP